jgi:predicted nuclease of predicted toxin-antitoxin system
MSLRFFIDQCVPNSIIHTIRNAGHEVFVLRDYIPRESPDIAVIAKAQELNAILVSLNGDFADIVTYPPSAYQGIISIQLRNHPEIIPQLMARLIEYLSLHNSGEHYRGKLLIIEVYRIRVRE